MAALDIVDSNERLITFIREVCIQQSSMLQVYEDSCKDLDDLYLTEVMNGKLTKKQADKREYSEVLKVFTLRQFHMLNNLLYFASKELA